LFYSKNFLNPYKYDEKTIGVKVNYIACQEELSKFQENKQGIKTTL
jgi:hypothetical protein